MRKSFEILPPIREYLEKEAQRPLPGFILRRLGDLRNEEQRRKLAMWPPRRVVKKRLPRPW